MSKIYYSFYFSGANGNYRKAKNILGTCQRKYLDFGIFEIVLDELEPAFAWENEGTGGIELHSIPANKIQEAYKFLEKSGFCGDFLFSKIEYKENTE